MLKKIPLKELRGIAFNNYHSHRIKFMRLPNIIMRYPERQMESAQDVWNV